MMERPLASTIFTVLALLSMVMMLLAGILGGPILGFSTMEFAVSAIGLALMAYESVLARIWKRPCPECPPCPPICPPWTHYLAIVLFAAFLVVNVVLAGSVIGVDAMGFLASSIAASILGIEGHNVANAIQTRKNM